MLSYAKVYTIYKDEHLENLIGAILYIISEIEKEK